MPGTNNSSSQSMLYDPPPPPGTCEGNEWKSDHTFYPDWYHQPNSPTDMQPLVYNNKVYVPDRQDLEMRIFDGNSWEHLYSLVPVDVAYKAASFTIGNKGYLAAQDKLYQYSFTTNSWLRKADPPFEARYAAAAFSIGTKGYVCAGIIEQTGMRYKDLWEYNSVNNTWTRKADLPVAVVGVAFFVVNNKAYITCGSTASSVNTDALYEYDPATNNWSVKEPFPGGPRAWCVAFVIDGKPYCGGGSVSGDQKKDYYRYNPSSNTWTRVADMSVNFMKTSKYGFSINSKAYVVYTHTLFDDVYTVKYSPLICTAPL